MYVKIINKVQYGFKHPLEVLNCISRKRRLTVTENINKHIVYQALPRANTFNLSCSHHAVMVSAS